MDVVRRNKENSNAEEPTKKEKKENFLLEHLRDYTSHTSLHGLQYFGEHALYIVERLFWLIMFVTCVTCSTLLIKNVWIKWQQSPVIVSFAETLTPVWKVPFPAVTICPKNKAQQSKYNYSREFQRLLGGDLNDEEKMKLEDISIICEGDVNDMNYRNIVNSSMVENLLSVAPQMDFAFSYCTWREHDIDCDKLFTNVLTNKGLCFTFNSLSAEEMFRYNNMHQDYIYTEENRTSKSWSPEYGYSGGARRDAYPRRGRSFGADYDLVVALRENKSDLNLMCDGPVRGFEVLLHHPAEMPRLSQYYIEVKPGEEKKVAVELNMETTSETLRSYDPDVRQCYFPTERYLRYFQVYTQKNCELECRKNYTYAMCGCVSFYMPHSDSEHICSSGKANCTILALEELAESLAEEEEEVVSNATQAKLDRIARSCKCLPACTHISYDSSSTSSKVDLSSYVKNFGPDFLEKRDAEILDELKMSRISFFFKDAQFISMRRSELYGPTDFLANCGGLLGLFHGFSVLSLIEIIYYLTLRLVCVIRRARVSEEIKKRENAERNKLI